MSSGSDKPSTIVVSAIASFALAAILGIAGFYLLFGMAMVSSGVGTPRIGARASRGFGLLSLIGVALGAGSLAMVWVGWRVIWDGLINRKPERDLEAEEREFYSQFPAPKD